MILVAFNSFLAMLLCIPAVTLVAGGRKNLRLASSLLLLTAVTLGALVGGACWWRGGGLTLDLSGFGPLPLALTIDRLSAFFLLLIGVVAAPVVLFSVSYVERHYEGPRRTWLWTLLPWFLLSMVIVVTASTGFAFLFGWELMTLVSAGLILIDGDSKERLHNVFIYLVMMHAGAAAVVGAFMLFLPHAAGLSFVAMRSAVLTMSPAMRTAVFLLAFVGFGTKAGIIPLHLWLPRAHPIAPSPISALMSGVMLKTAIYGFIRFTFDFLGTGPSWWGYLALAVGAVSGLLGVLFAIAENDLKRLLAYSSVENIGIIYLGLGGSMVFAAHHEPGWAALALCAALLHSLNHALFKSLLFLGAGAVSDATHTLDIEDLGGLVRRMPTTGAAYLIACCSVAGLPLFNGFVSEWMVFRSFLAGASLTTVPAVIVMPLMMGALALIGGLAAACFAKVYGVAFLGRPRTPQAEDAGEVPLPMRAAMMLLAGACVLIGIFPGIMLRPLSVNAQYLLGGAMLPPEISRLADLMPGLALALVAMIVAGVAIRRVTRRSPTWACGLPSLDSRMQYTATAFSKPIRKVFAQVYRPDRTVEILPADDHYFPSMISYRSVRTTSFERSLYRPAMDAIVATGHRLRRLQTGNIQVYLLYVFLALLGVLMFMRFA
jgi:hydrogenase-4 component B